MLDLSRAHAWGEAHSTAISSTDSILNMNESDLRSDVHYLGSSENKIRLSFISLSAVQIYDLHIFLTVYSSLHGFI